MRSRAGVGMTPPKVPGAPKPTSSVMMSSTLGAPFGGTTRGAHQPFDSEAFSLISPPNFGSGGGSCLPSMVVVALGEPSSPEIVWAMAGTAASMTATTTASIMCTNDFLFIRFHLSSLRLWVRSSRHQWASNNLRVRVLLSDDGGLRFEPNSSVTLNLQITPPNGNFVSLSKSGSPCPWHSSTSE